MIKKFIMIFIVIVCLIFIGEIYRQSTDPSLRAESAFRLMESQMNDCAIDRAERQRLECVRNVNIPEIVEKDPRWKKQWNLYLLEKYDPSAYKSRINLEDIGRSISENDYVLAKISCELGHQEKCQRLESLKLENECLDGYQPKCNQLNSKCQQGDAEACKSVIHVRSVQCNNDEEVACQRRLAIVEGESCTSENWSACQRSNNTIFITACELGNKPSCDKLRELCRTGDKFACSLMNSINSSKAPTR